MDEPKCRTPPLNADSRCTTRTTHMRLRAASSAAASAPPRCPCCRVRTTSSGCSSAAAWRHVSGATVVWGGVGGWQQGEYNREITVENTTAGASQLNGVPAPLTSAHLSACR